MMDKNTHGGQEGRLPEEPPSRLGFESCVRVHQQTRGEKEQQMLRHLRIHIYIYCFFLWR
jgi:hypothetical protein